MKDDASSGRISDAVVELCTSGRSVSSLLADDPGLAPGEAWERLYGGWKASEPAQEDGERHLPQPDLERAARCGKWGPTRPSELFLKVHTHLLSQVDFMLWLIAYRSITMHSAL